MKRACIVGLILIAAVAIAREYEIANRVSINRWVLDADGTSETMDKTLFGDCVSWYPFAYDDSATYYDYSTAAYNGSQATGTKQPTFTTANGGGFDFDGGDYIGVNVAAASGSAGSFTAWITVDSSNQHTIVSSADEASATRFIMPLYTKDGYLKIDQRNNDTQDRIRTTNVMIVQGVRTFIGVSCNGTSWTLNVNGTNQAVTVELGSNTGDWFAETGGRDNLTFGVLKRTTEAVYYDGIIYEVRQYNRALTEAEFAAIKARTE